MIIEIKIPEVKELMQYIECIEDKSFVCEENIKDFSVALSNYYNKKPKINKNKIYENIICIWNKHAEEHDCPRVKILSSDRKKKINKALTYVRDISDWEKIIAMAVTKSFESNDGRMWIANFDYMFRNNNYLKLLEEFDCAPDDKNNVIREFDSYFDD